MPVDVSDALRPDGAGLRGVVEGDAEDVRVVEVHELSDIDAVPRGFVDADALRVGSGFGKVEDLCGSVPVGRIGEGGEGHLGSRALVRGVVRVHARVDDGDDRSGGVDEIALKDGERDLGGGAVVRGVLDGQRDGPITRSGERMRGVLGRAAAAAAAFEVPAVRVGCDSAGGDPVEAEVSVFDIWADVRMPISTCRGEAWLDRDVDM